MTALYRKAWIFEQEMLRADVTRVQAELGVLTQRYPLYGDFDLLGVRHFIPYRSAAESFEEDAVSERYLDISRFMILTNIRTKSSRPIFNEPEDTILRTTMRREIDYKFRARIIDAMEKYDMVRSANNPYVRIDYDDQRPFCFPSAALCRFEVGPLLQRYARVRHLLSFL
jgi:hypothetical protein